MGRVTHHQIRKFCDLGVKMLELPHDVTISEKILGFAIWDQRDFLFVPNAEPCISEKLEFLEK